VTDRAPTHVPPSPVARVRDAECLAGGLASQGPMPIMWPDDGVISCFEVHQLDGAAQRHFVVPSSTEIRDAALELISWRAHCELSGGLSEQ
jgi:muconolactone delta-isomerase